MLRRSQAFVCLSLTLSFFAVLLPEQLHAQEFHVGGTTLKMTQPDEEYDVLPKIRISAWRQGPVGGCLSDENGKIDCKLPAGTPVKLLFEGPDGYLPELQALAAAPGMSHTVHVTLLTIDQAKKQGIDPYKHVKAILDYISSQGVAPDSRQLQKLRRLLQRLG